MTAKKKKTTRTPKSAVTSLYIRGFDGGVVTDLKRRAGARGLSHADYVTKLIELHAAMLFADQNGTMLEMLGAVGLGKIES